MKHLPVVALVALSASAAQASTPAYAFALAAKPVPETSTFSVLPPAPKTAQELNLPRLTPHTQQTPKLIHPFLPHDFPITAIWPLYTGGGDIILVSPKR